MAIHTGHRQRVRAKLSESGPDAFLPHELLEYLLFHAIPYKDTNPTAHLLLEKGGDLAGVFALMPEEVKEIPGCQNHVAHFLALVGECAKRALREQKETASYDTRESLVALAMDMVKGKEEEATWVVLFSNRYSILSIHKVMDGYYAASTFQMSYIAAPALKENASMALLVTNHWKKGARADVYERETSWQIRRSLALLGVGLLDHLIVSGNVVASAMETADDRANGCYRYHRFCHESMDGEEVCEDDTPLY